MTSINISLPEGLQQFVQERVDRGEYGTASDYIAELIRQDQGKQDEEQRLERLLLEALDSPAAEMTAADWDAIRCEALERLSARKSA